jgi:hypothetical protein
MGVSLPINRQANKARIVLSSHQVAII